MIAFACSLGMCINCQVKGFSTKKMHHQCGMVSHDVKKPCKDDCCNNEVNKIYQIDKAVPSFITIPVSTPIFLHPFNVLNNNYPLGINVRSTKYFVRGHHPPISDIRIAIKSFQI